MPQQRLELTWIGKGQEPQLEPRLLIEDPDKSYGDTDAENLLIHGDNLLALKALEQEYAGKVKCVYIDPPYNINAAGIYEDNLEHSVWLSLMKARIEILYRLLSDEGCLFLQIDDYEMAYIKIVLDEIFGRDNFLNQVAVKMKQTSGASGGGEDKKLKKNIEFILVYTKNSNSFDSFNSVYEEENLMDAINEMREKGKSWKYTRIVRGLDQREYVKTIEDGSGEPIKIFKHKNIEYLTVKDLMKKESLSEEDCYFKFYDEIFRDTNAQSSIRTRVMEATEGLGDFFSIDYVPRSGRHKGKMTTLYYKGRNRDLLAWLSDICDKGKTKLVKKTKLGTYWKGFNLNNLTKEGGFKFPHGKKPEQLIQTVLELATNPGDLVLDSFLGSGTTAAVAHKMGRRWIGIELGEHANTHCLPRLKKVVDGLDEGGITKAQNWQGGGGFKFYNLAPSLLRKDDLGQWVIDEAYNADQLAAAMAKHEGYTYAPDADRYWKQASSTENDYLYTTTQLVTAATIDRIAEQLGPDESLLICCKAYQSAAEGRDPRINLHKIPAMLTDRCEFGKDDYSLNIIDAPKDEDAPAFVPAGQLAAREAEAEELRKYGKQKDMFD